MLLSVAATAHGTHQALHHCWPAFTAWAAWQGLLPLPGIYPLPCTLHYRPLNALLPLARSLCACLPALLDADKLLIAFIMLTLFWGAGSSLDAANVPNLSALLFMVALLPGFAAVAYGEAGTTERDGCCLIRLMLAAIAMPLLWA